MSNPTPRVKRGDFWELTTNNGVIVRHVRSIACGYVSYMCNGELRRCSLDTFKSWSRRAELTFRAARAPEEPTHGEK